MAADRHIGSGTDPRFRQRPHGAESDRVGHAEKGVRHPSSSQTADRVLVAETFIVLKLSAGDDVEAVGFEPGGGHRLAVSLFATDRGDVRFTVEAAQIGGAPPFSSSSFVMRNVPSRLSLRTQYCSPSSGRSK